MKSLDSIGRKYKTDKSTLRHGYMKYYEEYFEPMRQSKICFFEIGISHGASALSWYEYFPNATFVFMDIFQGDHYDENPNLKKKTLNALKLPRITVIEGSQFDSHDLKKAKNCCPLGFDIVIDDASHVAEHQQFSMGKIFDHMKPNSLYCIEDLHTKRKTKYKYTLDMLKEFKSSNSMESSFINKNESLMISDKISSIDFMCKNKLSIIKIRGE